MLDRNGNGIMSFYNYRMHKSYYTNNPVLWSCESESWISWVSDPDAEAESRSRKPQICPEKMKTWDLMFWTDGTSLWIAGGLQKNKKLDPYSMNPDPQRFKRQAGKRLGDAIPSVADPGCLSRIWIFSIPDPGTEGTGTRIWIPNHEETKHLI